MQAKKEPIASPKRARHNKQFKLEAVRLLGRGDKPVVQLAAELGVPRNQLYKWQREVREKGEAGAFRGQGALPMEERSQIAQLKAQLKRVTEERDILKKFQAYLAKQKRK